MSLTRETISILDFYKGKRNYYGKTIEDIWKYSDEDLETRHDFIQYIFPLKERSHFYQVVPPITQKEINVIKNDPKLLNKVLKSFDVMLSFYGLIYDERIDRIVPRKKTFQYRALEPTYGWLINTHNFLRITRIIKSLGLFGLKHQGRLFFIAMCDIYRKYGKYIGKETWKFWKDAAKEYLS